MPIANLLTTYFNQFMDRHYLESIYKVQISRKDAKAQWPEQRNLLRHGEFCVIYALEKPTVWTDTI